MVGDEGFEPSLFQVPNQENCSLGLPLDHSLPARLPIAPIAHIKRGNSPQLDGPGSFDQPFRFFCLLLTCKSTKTLLKLITFSRNQ